MKKLKQSIPHQWTENSCYFLSPHPDDAIFSCGTLIEELKKKNKNLIIITVFSAQGSPPYSKFATKYLKACNYTNANDLAKKRTEEDISVAKKLGIKLISLNFIDAAWRKYEQKSILDKCKLFFYPEKRWLYPNPISIKEPILQDTLIMEEIYKKLKKIIKPNSIIFAPFAKANVDHFIVKKVSSKLGEDDSKIIYWQDLPYTSTDSDETKYLKRNDYRQIYSIKSNKLSKIKLIRMYDSQSKMNFEKNILQTEKYFIKTKNPS